MEHPSYKSARRVSVTQAAVVRRRPPIGIFLWMHGSCDEAVCDRALLLVTRPGQRKSRAKCYCEDSSVKADSTYTSSA